MNLWNNLSLQLKLQLTIVIFMVVTLIFAQFWIQHRFEEQAINQAKTTILDEADNIANALTTMMLTGVISERKVYLDQLTNHENIKAIHVARNAKVIEQYGEGVDNEAIMDALEKGVVSSKKPAFEKVIDDGQDYLRGVIPVIASEDEMGKNCLECHDVPSGYVNGTISVTISLKEVEEFIDETERLLWMGQIGWQVLLFLIITFIMQLLLTKPLARVKGTIESIAQNHDLTLKVDYSYNDELGDIATQMNHLMGELQNDFEKIADGADQVSGYSTKIKESSSHINYRSEQQGSKLSDMVASVEEISRTTQMVANNTAEVASLSENASHAAVEGGEIIRQSIEGISHIRDTVISIANTIESLQERSQQIGEITTVIDDIAEQTNLLALNAAIEAARAGEQGRGFAVVADEVRKLAERTSKATQEITQRISAIQAETGKAAEGMTKGQEEVENGVTLAEQAGESLRSIVGLVEDVSSKLSNISISMDEQKTAVEEIASNASEVASHASDNEKDIGEANKVAEELEEIANDLHSLINTFKF